MMLCVCYAYVWKLEGDPKSNISLAPPPPKKNLTDIVLIEWKRSFRSLAVRTDIKNFRAL